MITKFDKKTCKEVADQVIIDLQNFADENGLVIEKGRGSYSEHNFTLKLEINIKGQDSKEMTALKEHLEYLNETLTKKIDINKSYTDGSQTFKLTGYKTRARKRPYIITDQNGNSYVTNENYVKLHFADKKGS